MVKYKFKSCYQIYLKSSLHFAYTHTHILLYCNHLVAGNILLGKGQRTGRRLEPLKDLKEFANTFLVFLKINFIYSDC